MQTSRKFLVNGGSDVIVGAAIHNGHAIRDELLLKSGLTGDERLREEDPYTSLWAEVCESRIIGLCSRFEVDFNRPREKAVYRQQEDAWGLCVWNDPLNEAEIARSLEIYDQFYRSVYQMLARLLQEHPLLAVLDLHSYNHRRNGSSAPPADPAQNPEVNIGTGTLDRNLWGPLLDHLINDLRKFDFNGRHLDVRENVKFQGGDFGKWIHATFPGRVCAPAIEFKKFFMDEWTGRSDIGTLEWIKRCLRSSLPGIREELKKVNSGAQLKSTGGTRFCGQTIA